LRARFDEMIALVQDIFPKVRSQLREDIKKCPSAEVSEEDWNSHSFKSQLLCLAETELRIFRFGLPEADWNSWQSLEEVAEEWHKEDLGSWLSEVAWSSPIYMEDNGRVNDETKQVLGRIQAGETWPVAVDQGYSQPWGDVNLIRITVRPQSTTMMASLLHSWKLMVLQGTRHTQCSEQPYSYYSQDRVPLPL
jgi:hypothetical protein